MDVSAFDGLQSSILALIAGAGAIGVVLMINSMGWDVGMSVFKKLVKKGAK